MPLINSETILMLTCSEKGVLSNDTQKARFTIIDTKLYVPVVTLLTQDNVKLLQELK